MPSTNLSDHRRRFLPCFIVATVAIFFGGANAVWAQIAGVDLWHEITEQQAAGRLPAALKSVARRDIVPQVYRTLVLEKEFMAQLLGAAPSESAKRSTRSGSEIILPLPEGGYGRFSVLESPLMEPDLAAQFPEIKNYVVQGIDDPTATGRIDTSKKGFRAMVISADGTFFIDPYWSDSDDVSICYAKKDFVNDDKMKAWSCGVQGGGSTVAALARAARGPQRPTGATLRVYRAAIAATGEYTAFHGGTVPLALAAINTSLARVNTVYERDFCIRMILVANNTSIIYTNAGTDPYSNGDPGLMIDENQSNVDSVIGNANYDIGHVFGTDSGGLAGLGVVCETGFKAQGVTGSDAPVNDPFDIDYVAHEMGHQFAGNHTFNASGNGNRNGTTAFEPGSGSTIMAYAGIVSGQNLQRYSDDHFHTGSYTEIDNFTTTGAGAGAFSNVPTGNNVPVIAALPSYTIPARTPFALTASATDADGDALTYCWEQYDVGPQQNPVTANPRDNGSSPIFRSYSPTTNATRFFPSIPYILNNTNIPPATYTSNGVSTWATGEAIPTTSRTMTFRVSVRDNRAGGGGHNWASTQVTTLAGAGPFRVSSQNTATSVPAGVPFNITWDVAGTAAAPISATDVKISLSTNGGTNFPVVLAASVPNNGTASVIIPPGIDTSFGRIKVEAVGNIFFDINDVNLTVRDAGIPVVRIDSPLPGVKLPPGQPFKVVVTATDLDNLLQPPGTITNVTLNVDGLPVATDTAAPYEFFYTASAPKTIELTASATDTDLKTGLSVPVQVVIGYLGPGEIVDDFVPPGANDHVQALAADPQNRIYVGGRFTQLVTTNGLAVVTNQAPRIGRLLSDGSVDPSFFAGSGPDDQVRALLHVPSDKSLYVGGNFAAVDGKTNRALVRLRTGQTNGVDGSVDPSFAADIDGPSAASPPYIRSIARQDDGKLLVGGFFTKVQGATLANLARFNTNGTLDTSFAPNPSGAVHSIVLQSDGKILVGGSFASVGGSTSKNIARLNRDGSLDTNFVTGVTTSGGFNGAVNSVAVTLNGEVIAGGAFSAYNGRSFYSNMAKLLPNGVVDGKFNFTPGLNGIVNDLHVRPTGEILVSGLFTQVGNSAIGLPATTAGRVLQIISGGASNGSLDAAFNPGGTGADNSVLDSITLPNGDILLAGSFTSFNGVPRSRLAVVAGFDKSRPAVVSPSSFNIDAGNDLNFSFVPSGTGPFSFSNSAGTVPRGVKFDTNSGKLTGVPLDAGSYEFQIVATSGQGSSVPVRFVLGVNTSKVSYNQWKKAWFTNASELTNAAVSGPAAVRNGAGLNNFLVYALDGGNPVSAERVLAPTVIREVVAGQTYLTLTAPKYPGADVVHRVEASGDLSTWGSSEPADVVTISNSATGIKVRAATPAGQTNRQFLRLKVLAP